MKGPVKWEDYPFIGVPKILVDVDGTSVHPNQINALIAERDRAEAQLKTIWDGCRNITGHPEVSSKSPVSVMFEMFGSLMAIAGAAKEFRWQARHVTSHPYSISYLNATMELKNAIAAHEKTYGPIGGE